MRNLETSIINSALWAAAGDAVGWISELTDSRGLERRAGTSVLTKPVAWKRKIGGIRGVSVDLKSGTYSDDTQLRLAVCRSIRGDGVFDAEPFAKIELTIWLSYALGAGRGSKAAASNLIKRDVNWFSNFYDYDADRSYIKGGGNGAAMRIQPHVWKHAGKQSREYLDDVVKDALITHGNMRGICGAVFHADCIAFALRTSEVPGPKQWRTFVERLPDIEGAIQRDVQLSRFWLAHWEQLSKESLSDALFKVSEEMSKYLDALDSIQWEQNDTYAQILEVLNALAPAWRGTGSNTALAAAALVWNGRKSKTDEVILEAANAIGSDTDTIASMAGAIAGAISSEAPLWPIQDQEYIIMEARRMAKIARGLPCSSFAYPDLIGWQPPSTQSDAVGKMNGSLVMTGLGPIESTGECWKIGDFALQWFRTSFGQTLLCKTRAEIRLKIGEHLVPRSRVSNKPIIEPPSFELEPSPETHKKNFNLPLWNRATDLNTDKFTRAEVAETKPAEKSLDELTELVIQSNFDSKIIGDCLINCSSGENGIDRSIAFAAIISKALIARRRRARG